MKSLRMLLATGLLMTLIAAPLRAGDRELLTVESAGEVVHAFADIPLKGIPPAMLQDATGVAVIPEVVKAGLVLGGRFGRGVVLVRQPDGSWSHPVFITLTGGGIGLQAGIQSTDVILVFKKRHALDSILDGKGKLTLGGDASIAAGPIGRSSEAATDSQLKAEIYSYSRSRGLFAGLSLEGARMSVDQDANIAFYGVRGGRPAEVLAFSAPSLPAVESLKGQLTKLSGLLRPPPAAIYPPRMQPLPAIPIQTPPPPVSGPPMGPPVPVPYR
jgi:lipid-binding SYLF domain-containing protein